MGMVSHDIFGWALSTGELQLRLESAIKLIKEVHEWHSDPESADYNHCDEAPCAWCRAAEELIGGVSREA